MQEALQFKQRHSQTLWWNDDVDGAVNRKRELFKIPKRSSNEEIEGSTVRQKKVFKRVVTAAMDQTSREATENVEINCDGCELFRIAKQKAKKWRDVLGVNCRKEEKGNVKATVDEHQSIWKNRMEKLTNVENEWGDFADHAEMESPVSMIEFEELDSSEAHAEQEGQ